MPTVTHTLQSAIRDFPSPLGFITAYIPEELFQAAGFTPLFVFPTPQDRGHARAHLPSFTCWIVGSVFEQALAGELDGMVAMALAKTCDTTQGLADLWPWNVQGIPCLHFGMPLRLDGPAARTCVKNTILDHFDAGQGFFFLLIHEFSFIEFYNQRKSADVA